MSIKQEKNLFTTHPWDTENKESFLSAGTKSVNKALYKQLLKIVNVNQLSPEYSINIFGSATQDFNQMKSNRWLTNWLSQVITVTSSTLSYIVRHVLSHLGFQLQVGSPHIISLTPTFKLINHRTNLQVLQTILSKNGNTGIVLNTTHSLTEEKQEVSYPDILSATV